MKKLCIVFAFLLILLATAAITAQEKPSQTSAYLRMHVRANSDDLADQQIKYEVKDAIVQYLIPVVADCTDKPSAIAALTACLDEVEQVADEVLSEHGFAYRATARVCRESFPDRVYEGVTPFRGRVRCSYRGIGRGRGRKLVVRGVSSALFFGRGDGANDTIPFSAYTYIYFRKIG